MTPQVVVLSAPSGAGKTTITRALLAARPDVGFSVSATSRAPRAGERHGEAYYFVSREEFARRRAAAELLEWAEYAGHWYGTLRGEVERILAGGRHALLDIEIEGARQVRAAYPPPRSVSIFVLPPSAAALLERLRGRESEPRLVLARRLARAVSELREVPRFDYVVVNDALDAAVADVGAILDGRAPRPPDPEALVQMVNTLAAALGRESARLRREP
ncbi:MAG: guanylate kinase [Gemmatimonadales bacterium]